MSKLKGKLARRIMAIVLSGAMVMSNMSAYAAELSTETTTETVSEVEETAAAETQENSDNEKSEAESPAAESSESTTDKVGAEEMKSEAATSEEATEAKTEEASTESKTEAETETASATETENTSETETVSVEETQTGTEIETETIEAESTTEETSTEVETEVVEKETDNKSTPNVLDIGALISDGTLTAKTYESTAGTDVLEQTIGIFTLKSGGGKFTVDGNNVSVSSGDDANLTFTGRIKTEGSGNTSKRVISFDAAKGAKIIAYFQTGSGGTARELILSDGTSEVTKASNSVSGTPTKLEYTTEADGTYYLYGGANVQIFYVSVEPAKEQTVTKTEELNIGNLISDGTLTAKTYESTAGTDVLEQTIGIFTLKSGGGKFTVDGNNVSVPSGDDAIGTFTGRIKTEGSGNTSKRVISFNAVKDAKIVAYFQTGSGGTARELILSDGTSEVTKASNSVSGTPTKLEYTTTADGTYYLYGGANIQIFYVSVTQTTTGEEEPIDRGNWDTDVAAPEITDVQYNTGDKSIQVTAKGVVDRNGKGADSITIEMYDARATDGEPLASASKSATKAEEDYKITEEFTPEDSANYIFRAVLKRGDDKDADGNVTATYADKVSAFSDPVAFKIPLSAPSISLVKNMGKDENGKGVIDVSWEKVKEAEDYTLYVNAQDGTELYKQDSIEGLSAQVSGLEIGTTVNVTAKAVRGEGDESPLSDAKPVEVSGVEAKTYTFNGLDYVDEASSSGVSQNPGRKLGTEDYFSVYIADGTPASGTLLRTASNNTLCFLQVYQAAGSGLRFTTWGSSSATFTVASTGSSNWSVFGLMDSEGNLVKAEKVSGPSQPAITYGNAYAIQTTGLTTIDYIGLEPGTYTFLTPQVENPQNGVNGRGGRIHSAIINDEGEMPERGSWEAVEAPAISEVSYVRGQETIEVKASGYIGLYGADALKVEMLDKDGEVVESNVNAQDSTVAEDGTVTNPEQTFTFKPTASGAYSFRASLTRSNETDKPMTDSVDDWKITEFVLPLKTPSVGAMTNIADTQDGKGGLEVIFTGVDEADYYIIAAYKNNEFNKENAFVDLEVVQEGDVNKLSTVKYEEGKDSEYTVRLEGMDLGTCYVTAQAFRNSDSSLNLKAETTTIKRDETGKAVSTTEFTKKDGEETSIETSETDAETRNAIAVVRSKAANGSEKYTNGKNDTRWFHTVYGSNTSRVSYNRGAALDNIDHQGTGATPANGYKENVFTEGDNKGDLQSVTIWSENGRGKVVPATTDGLSYYYTALDPENNNFTLSALVDVMSWTYSNGQDGFGMMVSDTVGKDGDDGDVWMNAYQLVASKIEYSYKLPVLNADGTVAEPGAVTNESGNGTTIMRYSMRLGLGWTSKLGATASDVAKIKAGTLTTPPNFKSTSGTLESFAGENGKPTGNYNIAGNVSNANAAPATAMGEGQNLLTKFRLQIQKYDNAYVLRYLAVDSTPEDQIDEADKLNTAKYIPIDGRYYAVLNYKAFSDDNNNSLTQIDKKNIYVGFFAARNARINVSEISLVTPPAGEDYVVPTEVINPNANFVSEEMSNNENYDLIYSGNFDGTVTIFKGTDAANLNEVLVRGMEVKAGTRYTFTSKMEKGDNYFQFHAKPNDNFVPGENQILSNHDMQISEPFKVVYNAFEGDTIYVKQNGAAVGTSDEAGNPAGSKENPTNIYDAVNHASAGQTILMAGGRYDLKGDAEGSRNLLVGRDHDGTPKAYITMKAEDPNNRPILDFGRKTIDKGSAFTIAGNYWKFQDFDVTGSIDGEKGVQLSGSHNVLQNLHTYLNGNTGLQVSRYLGSDSRADWPSYNTILNCSSYMNYDAGYEDADGYAAKLTCGDGNKFVGCIAAYNADDGWDLFAKRESGNIGVVTIENCLAFNNGYLFGEEDYYGAGQDLIYRDLSQITKNTHLVPAGNGNGFKMGGDSMSGYHVLRNSIAFGNKSKGIDSNSCPDIQLYNSISFNNEADNVALYTGGAPNTDYYAENIVSIKDSNCRSGGSTGDNPKPVGNQNLNKIYGPNNYYWSGSKSLNKAGEEFKASWFTHMNMEAAVFGSRKWQAISRDADGSINLHGFMEYTSDAPFDKFVGNTGEDAVLDTPIDIYVFADLYSSNNAKLSDIKLSSFDKIKEEIPEYANYKWLEPDTSLAAFAGTAADFTVTYTGEGTKPNRTICVNFIQFDGAQLLVTEGDEDGDGILDDGEEWTVEAVPVISPAVDPDPAISGFKAEITETTKGLLKSTATAEGETYPGLRVSGGQKKFVNTKKNGTAELTAVVSLTINGKTVKKNAALDIKVKNAEGIVFDNVIAGSGTGQYADMIEWTSDDDDILVSMGAGTLTMENLHFANRAFGKGVRIRVNDTSVIKLTNTTKRGNGGVDATFAIVNKSGEGGTATVTVTSIDDKTLVRNYVVTVRGDDLAWNEDNIALDKAKTAGVQLMVLAPFGHEVDTTKDIKVAKAYRGTKLSGTNYANMFNVNHQVKTIYELNTDAKAAGLKNTQLPSGTYTLVCTGYLTGEDSPIEFTPITVRVKETKPNLSIKQTKKVNLFYNNGTVPGTGALTAGSKNANVTLTMVDANGNAISDNGYFRLVKTTAGYDLVSIKTTKDNRRSPVRWNASARKPEYRDVIDHSTVSIKAQFEGYYDAYSITKDFKIGVEYKKPKLQLKAVDKTIYTAIGMDGARVLIYDPVTEQNLDPATATIELVTSPSDKTAYAKSNKDFTIGEVTVNNVAGVKLMPKAGVKKGGTLALKITYDDWYRNDAVVVKQTVQINTKTPTLRISAAKLNVGKSFVGNEQVKLPLVLSNSAVMKGDAIEIVSLAGKNSTETAFLNKYLNHDIGTDDEGNTVLLMNLQTDENGKFPSTANAKGVYKMNKPYKNSYTCVLSYKLGNQTKAQTATFRLSLVGAKESVTVSASGSINLANRLGSTVTLKPRMKNFTIGQVAGVTLTGDAANQFEIVEFDKATGATVIRAKETAVLKTGRYKILPKFTFDLGHAGTITVPALKPIYIKTVQSKLKISGLKSPLQVKLSSPETPAKRKIAITSPNGAFITEMTQTSGLDNFTLSYDEGGGNVSVVINNRAGLKEGVTYKITAVIDVEGAGVNVKQQQITIPVKVIK